VGVLTAENLAPIDRARRS